MLEKQGLVKLVEECGELIQIAGKKMARMDSDDHWDRSGSLRTRLEDEVADVKAIIQIIQQTMGLDVERIELRQLKKWVLFNEWLTKDEAEVVPLEPEGEEE